MAYSTDAEIIRAIGELQTIRTHATLSGADVTLSRIRALLERVEGELQAVHEEGGEVPASAEFRSGNASLIIAIGYLWGAISEHAKGEANASEVLRNSLWTACSYLEAGTALVLAATQESNLSPITGIAG